MSADEDAVAAIRQFAPAGADCPSDGSLHEFWSLKREPPSPGENGSAYGIASARPSSTSPKARDRDEEGRERDENNLRSCAFA
jgi:hypothetical protein